MLIREIFATTIQERIEPVVKVADRNPAVLLGELKNLVVTPQWETYLHRVLEAYSDAFDREDEQGIGIWISGFFGSGKSLLMKELGVLLEGGELLGESVHRVFLSRLPSHSEERTDLERFLAICRQKLSTSVIGGNLHAQLASSNEPLALIVFRLFAKEHGYTHNWPLAWAVEYQLDRQGLSSEFHRVASELSGVEWSDVANDPDFYNDVLYQAAATVLPEHFKGGPEAVERAVMSAVQTGITPAMLIDRLRRWCVDRDNAGRRHKLLLQLDELGQWIASGNVNERTMQVQALVETAAQAGHGRIWMAVTAHGDVQELQQNVQQEQYAKINQRFALQCKLSNEDINQVVEERLLRKTQSARIDLTRRFDQRSGEITDLGSVQQAQRVFPAPDGENFARFYPYFPWTVVAIPNVVKGIAQATGRDEALTGSNRTMIGVVQGGIIDTPGLLNTPVGRILCLADLYDQLASDAPIETRTDINRIITTVSDATPFTTQVARALYLLGQIPYIPCTLENVTRALVDSLDINLASRRMEVKHELERLVAAGYAKQVGETYLFLNTQQRSFQDKVRSRQEELSNQTYELSQKLREYEGEDALRFDQVSLAGREIRLKLEIDGRGVRNPSMPVTIHVYSPFQRALEPQIADDTVMKQRSQQDPDNLFFRMAETKGLRRALALALATEEIANQVLANQANTPEGEVARQAKQVDLPSYKNEVRHLLTQAVRGGTIFFRGSDYQLLDGDNASDAVRKTLSQLLPSIYSRFSEVPYRIMNEETAVKAALGGNTTNTDLQNLGVYKNDGTLNGSHMLISTLRVSLPQASDDQGAIPADQLRSKFERPPYGWDGNCIKVGLALLLRASACRLIVTGRTITDPNSPEALQYLTKEQSFKTLRVQGIRTDLDIQQLQEIRGYMQTIFNFSIKPALVPATLNNILGEQLMELAGKAQNIKNWATTARCPLPLTFEAGSSLVSELLDSAAPSVRLTRFQEQWETLFQYTQMLDTLTIFQRQHGAEFLTMRDFFSSMVNAEVNLPELRRFISDWRVVIDERSVTEANRWNELMKTYHAAQQAVTNQIAAWQQEARKSYKEMQAHLKEQVLDAGVPDEQADAEVAALATDLQSAQKLIEQPNPSFSEARSLGTELGNVRMNLLRKLQELRERYGPIDQKPPQEVHLHWQALLGGTRLSSQDDLEQMLGRLRMSIAPELEQQKIVIID